MGKVIFGMILAAYISVILAEIKVSNIEEAIFAKYKEECRTETGFDHEEKSDENQMFDTPSAKCYIKCFALKAGIVNDKGEPQYDKIDTVFDIPTGMDIDTTMKKCYEDNKDKADICDRISGLQKCAIMEIHKFSSKT